MPSRKSKGRPGPGPTPPSRPRRSPVVGDPPDHESPPPSTQTNRQRRAAAASSVQDDQVPGPSSRRGQGSSAPAPAPRPRPGSAAPTPTQPKGPLHAKLCQLVLYAQNLTGKRNQTTKQIESIQEVFYNHTKYRENHMGLRMHHDRCIEHIFGLLLHLWYGDLDCKSPYVLAMTKFVVQFIIETSRETDDLESEYRVNSIQGIQPIFMVAISRIISLLKTRVCDTDSATTRVRLGLLGVLKPIIHEFHENTAFTADRKWKDEIIDLMQDITIKEKSSTNMKVIAIQTMSYFIKTDSSVSKFISKLIDYSVDNPQIIKTCVQAFHQNDSISCSTYYKILINSPYQMVQGQALIGLSKYAIGRIRKDRKEEGNILEGLINWGLVGLSGNESRQAILVKYLLKGWLLKDGDNLINLCLTLRFQARPMRIKLLLNALYPGNSYQTLDKMSSWVNFLQVEQNLIKLDLNDEDNGDGFFVKQIKYQLWYFLCDKFKNDSTARGRLIPKAEDYVRYVETLIREIIQPTSDTDLTLEKFKTQQLIYTLKIGEFVSWEESNRRHLESLLESILLNNKLDNLFLVDTTADMAAKIMDKNQGELIKCCEILLRRGERDEDEQADLSSPPPPLSPPGPDVLLSPATPESPNPEPSSSQPSSPQFSNPSTPKRTDDTVKCRIVRLEIERCQITLRRHKLPELSDSNSIQAKLVKFGKKESRINSRIEKLQELDPNTKYRPELDEISDDSWSTSSSLSIALNGQNRNSDIFPPEDLLSTSDEDQNLNERITEIKFKALVILDRALYWNRGRVLTQSPWIKSFIVNKLPSYLLEERDWLRAYVVRIIFHVGCLDKTLVIKSICVSWDATVLDNTEIVITTGFKCLIDLALRYSIQFLVSTIATSNCRIGFNGDLNNPNLSEEELQAQFVSVLVEINERVGAGKPKFRSVFVNGMIKLFLVNRIKDPELLAYFLRLWIDSDTEYRVVSDITTFMATYAKSTASNGQRVSEALISCVNQIVTAFEESQSFGSSSVEKLVKFVISCITMEFPAVVDYLATKVLDQISPNLSSRPRFCVELIRILKYSFISNIEIANRIQEIVNEFELGNNIANLEEDFAIEAKKLINAVKQKVRKVLISAGATAAGAGDPDPNSDQQDAPEPNEQENEAENMEFDDDELESDPTETEPEGAPVPFQDLSRMINTNDDTDADDEEEVEELNYEMRGITMAKRPRAESPNNANQH